MAPILNRFRSIVITSGTLSPADMYPRILNFHPVLAERLSMSLSRDCVCPQVVIYWIFNELMKKIVSRGSDQGALTSRFEVRSEPSVIRNYGSLLVEMSTIVPGSSCQVFWTYCTDGVVCFFPSYQYMEQIIVVWNEMKILNNVLSNKLVFIGASDLSLFNMTH